MFRAFWWGFLYNRHHLLEFDWPFDFDSYNLHGYHAQKINMEPKHVGFQKESPFLAAENLRFPSKNYLGDDLIPIVEPIFLSTRVSSLIRAAAAAAAAVPMEEAKLCSAAAADTKRSTPRCKSHVLRDSAAVETPQTRLCKVKKPPKST